MSMSGMSTVYFANLLISVLSLMFVCLSNHKRITRVLLEFSLRNCSKMLTAKRYAEYILM